jgi:hypothetical protein
MARPASIASRAGARGADMLYGFGIGRVTGPRSQAIVGGGPGRCQAGQGGYVGRPLRQQDQGVSRLPEALSAASVDSAQARTLSQ